ncbi:PepSY domain-containing protein [uncultured Aquimarina sp.]|uniref:PepSY domain-containing protein n=1 Tax=uncultured Aquimarina sp. TaxID=575652 RepID=UPI00261260FB|nr:PepSY domain-containing protein [uncultured Aquimarina sp.]
MVKRKTAIIIRKSHRYLGIFLGIQFLMWTISGLYFSWTDIDEIHGDQFKKEVQPISHNNLLKLDAFSYEYPISSLELKTIASEPYYWINDSVLIHAQLGNIKEKISKEDALKVASEYLIGSLKVKSIDFITEVGKHHEYRGRPLPAYVISYDHPENIKAYVSALDGSFQRVRHQSWRWFDFLWMTHTMDYEGRDNFNTIVLRVFSLLGLITVLSGFVLWYISSPTLRKIFKR